jgi:two-component system NtrC family sensor kinase
VNDFEPLIAVTEEALSERLALMQDQLDGLREQLTESQRLATIGTISAVIAHEFNNLLTPIVSYCQVALQSAEGEKPDMDLIRKALTKSFQSSSKAGRICTSMLGLARGESIFGHVSVQKIVDETLVVLMVDADPVQLEQVLLNLLINARHALLGKGGSITIKAQETETGENRIQVIDTGPGIPEKLIPKIFQPFFTTKATARKGEPKGTGLGLAICREIVEHHKGRIAVESTVGKGTTFTLHLPMA